MLMDQAADLRRIISEHGKRAQVASIVSGKGGVGKTNFAINVGITMVKKGLSVLLMDADLGLANVDILMGFHPQYNLSHVLSGKRTLDQVIYQGPNGLDFIPGASGIHDIVNMSDRTKRELIQSMEKMEHQYDIILIDTQAGVSDNVMSFVFASDEVFVVCTTEPTSVADAYATIKMIYARQKNKRIRMVVNMVNSEQEARHIYGKIAGVVRTHLHQELEYAGHVMRDKAVVAAVKSRRPFMLEFPRSAASKTMRLVAAECMPAAGTPSVVALPESGFFKKLVGVFQHA